VSGGSRERAFVDISPCLLAELPVEGVSSTDQREVREGPGEVAEKLAGGADLFGVEAEVVGVR
jgi:hypothetical protein